VRPRLRLRLPLLAKPFIFSSKAENSLDSGGLSLAQSALSAPVFQWIECWPPKPAIRVRLPTGVPVLDEVSYLMSSSSTSKTKVDAGGITGGWPRSP
jgi:hypothetical protein